MIIGLTGLKGSGKSTAAKHIESVYGFSRHNFKDALVAEILDNFPDLLLLFKKYHHLNIDELFSSKPEMMRALMQNYGTEVRRGDDPNYWVRKWSQSLPDSNVVVDDVRFINESESIREKDGVIIRIVRHDQEDDNDQHQSEQEQNQIKADFTVYAGTGKQEELYKQIDKVIHELKSNVD